MDANISPAQGTKAGEVSAAAGAVASAASAGAAKIGAIFDCDGTLMDTVGGWRSVESEFARMCGHELSLEEAQLLATFTLQETGDYYHNKYGLGKSAAHVIEMADEILVNYYQTQSELRPGVGEFLEGLAQAGVPMTVASSSPQRYLQAGLQHTGIAGYFKGVFSTDDVGAPKREPRIYLHAAQHMGSAPANTWGFEDSLYAVHTLVNAGFKCAGCYDRDDSGTKEQLQAAATLLIPSFTAFTAQEFLQVAF